MQPVRGRATSAVVFNQYKHTALLRKENFEQLHERSDKKSAQHVSRL